MNPAGCCSPGGRDPRGHTKHPDVPIHGAGQQQLHPANISMRVWGVMACLLVPQYCTISVFLTPHCCCSPPFCPFPGQHLPTTVLHGMPSGCFKKCKLSNLPWHVHTCQGCSF